MHVRFDGDFILQRKVVGQNQTLKNTALAKGAFGSPFKNCFIFKILKNIICAFILHIFYNIKNP